METLIQARYKALPDLIEKVLSVQENENCKKTLERLLQENEKSGDEKYLLIADRHVCKLLKDKYFSYNFFGIVKYVHVLSSETRKLEGRDVHVLRCIVLRNSNNTRSASNQYIELSEIGLLNTAYCVVEKLAFELLKKKILKEI